MPFLSLLAVVWVLIRSLDVVCKSVHILSQDDCGLYKNLLQDLTVKEGFSTPVYTTRSSGASHVPTFTATVEVEGDVFHGVAAKTKKQAEINAAKIAYFSLKERKSFVFSLLQPYFFL